MTVASAGRFAHDGRVLLVVFAPAGFPQLMFFVTLAIALYLTVIELREFQPRPHFTYWAWWLSLVFLTHFVGYLILRGYAAYRRRSQARA
jgi:hypothetical protein